MNSLELKNVDLKLCYLLRGPKFAMETSTVDVFVVFLPLTYPPNMIKNDVDLTKTRGQ